MSLTRKTIAALLLGTSLLGGVGAYALDQHSSQHRAIDATAHVDTMLKHLYVEVDATDAQKAQIEPLVKAAMQDLMPLHSQLRTAHTQMLTMLSQPTIDRAALEASRAQHMQMADQASRRLVQLIADVGDVLTPEQRKKLADHLSKLHQGGMHHHG